MVNSLKILQWNCNSASSHSFFLRKLLIDTCCDVALISETRYKPGQIVNIPGYQVIRKDHRSGKWGVAILVSIKFTYQQLSLGTNISKKLELCGIDLIIHNKKVSFISVYRPNKINVSSGEYINLFKQFRHTAVIAGDFNANHRSWGSTTQSNIQAGEKLLEAIQETPNLIILNDGSPTRVNRPGEGLSAVDVTLISSDLINSSSWEVLNDPCSSDHFPILTTLGSVQNNRDKNEIFSINRWRTEKADWDAYRYTISERFEDSKQELPTNEKLLFLIEVVHSASNTTMPKCKPHKTQNPKSPHWWDEECKRLNEQRQSAFKKYKSIRNMDNYVAYKKLDAMCKRTFKIKAKLSWINYCNSLNSQSNPSMIWSKAAKVSPKKTNVYIPSQSDIIEQMLNKIAPPSAVENFSTFNTYSHLLTEKISLYELEINIPKKKDLPLVKTG